MNSMTQDELKNEASSLEKLLIDKTVKKIWRHRTSELVIEFNDGYRLFVDSTSNQELEFSVTGGDQ